MVDGQPIPKDRLSRGSVTCRRECYDARRKAQRAQSEDHECKYCRKASTPAERDAWKKWRQLEKKFPGFLEKITTAQFNKLVAEWGDAPCEATVSTEGTPAGSLDSAEPSVDDSVEVSMNREEDLEESTE